MICVPRSPVNDGQQQDRTRSIDTGGGTPHPTDVSLAILHVVPYFYPAWSYGGIPRLVYGLARQQVRMGHRVTVVTTDALDASRRTSEIGWEAEPPGMHVERFRNVSNELAYRHQLFLPSGAARFLAEVMTEQDLVHLHGHRHLLNNLAVREAERHHVPVVMTPNGTLPILERKQRFKRLWDLALGERVLRRTDMFIAVSRAEVAQFRRAGITADRIHLVPNGIELDEFESRPRRGRFRRSLGIGDAPMVLYLGKITPRKGVDHLLEAFSRVATRGAHLVIAGNDMTGEMDHLRSLRGHLDLEKRVHFVGLLVGPPRLNALSDADVLVYPSIHEIFGLVPFEGLLSGTPVVVSGDCGCGELVARAGAGFLVPYGKADGLARHIDTLLSDPFVGSMMVDRGRAYIARHFAWPEVASKTEDVYEAATNRRVGRASAG